MTNLYTITEPVYGLAGHLIAGDEPSPRPDVPCVSVGGDGYNVFEPEMLEVLQFFTRPRSEGEVVGHLGEWEASLVDVRDLSNDGVLWTVNPAQRDDVILQIRDMHLLVVATPADPAAEDGRMRLAAQDTIVDVSPTSLLVFGAGGEGASLGEAVELAATAAQEEPNQVWDALVSDVSPLLDLGVAYFL